MKKNNRIYIIDTLRGILIILVILYHTMYDLNYMFGVNISLIHSEGMDIFRDGFVSILIFIAGISCNLSHNNTLRGIKTLGCALLISAVTAFFMPEQLIVFGILHFMGTSMLVYAAAEPLLKKINYIAGAAVMLILFFATYGIYFGFIGVAGYGVHFNNEADNIFMFILGFKTSMFSGDYYPLMPWIFMFLAGAFAGRDIKNKKIPLVFLKDYCPPLTFIGRHTLIIYMLHQPLIYGFLYMVFSMS